MARFMFVYRMSGEEVSASPEEMQKAMQDWTDWIQGGVEAGWLLDGGDGLKPEGVVIRTGDTVTDGPFAESKELVGGYSMVEAPDLAAATELAKGNPAVRTGGSVEVRELAGFTGD